MATRNPMTATDTLTKCPDCGTQYVPAGPGDTCPWCKLETKQREGESHES